MSEGSGTRCWRPWLRGRQGERTGRRRIDAEGTHSHFGTSTHTKRAGLLCDKGHEQEQGQGAGAEWTTWSEQSQRPTYHCSVDGNSKADDQPDDAPVTPLLALADRRIDESQLRRPRAGRVGKP